MPYPNYISYKENKIANNHAIEVGVPTTVPYNLLTNSDYNNQAQLRAMIVLNDYNPYGFGQCPNFDFIIPGGPYAGNKLNFIYTNAEVQYNGTPYSSLTGIQKKTVAFWLPYFLRYGMIQYDLNYNI